MYSEQYVYVFTVRVHAHVLRRADVAHMQRETEGPHPSPFKPRQMVRMQGTVTRAQEISALVHPAVIDFITSPITLSSHHCHITTMRREMSIKWWNGLKTGGTWWCTYWQSLNKWTLLQMQSNQFKLSCSATNVNVSSGCDCYIYPVVRNCAYAPGEILHSSMKCQ